MNRTTQKSAVVSRNPQPMNGTVFAGTRVPVDILIENLAAGESLDYLLGGLSGVSREQAVAYLETARETVEGSVRAGSAR